MYPGYLNSTILANQNNNSELQATGLSLRTEILSGAYPTYTLTGGTSQNLFSAASPGLWTQFVGQHGHGIQIIGSCTNITIDGPTIEKCYGDGIYIGTSGLSNGITVKNVISDGNRRQGLSITRGINILIQDCTFKNTSGTKPTSGIDIEPNNGSVIDLVTINRCTVTDNDGCGITSYSPGTNYSLSRMTITNNIVTGNHYVAGILLHWVYSKTGGTNSIITGNTCSNNTGIGCSGIRCIASIGDTISNNVCNSNQQYGIMINDWNANALSKNNTGTGNTGTGNLLGNLFNNGDNNTVTIT